MKQYEKPMIVDTEGMAEGVFAASGADEPECWTIDVRSVQDWDGANHVFEVHCVHMTGLKHISASSTTTFTFNNVLEDGRSEFTTTISGNTMTVTRELLGDAYNSGDRYTMKIWARASTEALTRGLVVTNATISCEHAVNVQGGFD